MPQLLYGTTDNSNLRYLVKEKISDSFFYLHDGKKGYIFLDKREYGIFAKRTKETIRLKNIKPVRIEPFIEKVIKESVGKSDKTTVENRLAWELIKGFGLAGRRVEVAADFPLDMGDYLRSKKVNLVVKRPFFPERSIKSLEEIRQIKKTVKKTLKAFEKIEKILKEAEITGKFLEHRGKTLTSEFLRYEAEAELLKYNLTDPEEMTISTGAQTIIAHNRGEGPILANQPLVCDIYPYDRGNDFLWT